MSNNVIPNNFITSSHTIWGGVEPPSETSGPSSTSASGGSVSEGHGEERKKKTKPIKNRALRLEEKLQLAAEAVQMLSNSDTTPESSKVSTAGGDANDPSLHNNSGLPSIGSLGHEEGTCKPCLFVFERVGCKAADSCVFCHMPHTKKSIGKQSKAKRDRFRKLVSAVEGQANPVNEDENRQPVPVGLVARGSEGVSDPEAEAAPAGGWLRQEAVAPASGGRPGGHAPPRTTSRPMVSL